MLRIEGRTTTWPQIDLPTGNLDWKGFRGRFYIPADTRLLSLNLGLEGSTGKVWMRNLVLKAAGEEALPPPAPADKTIFTGHGPGQLRGAMIQTDLDRKDFDVLTRDWKANLVRWQLTRSNDQDASGTTYTQWLDSMLVKLDEGLSWARENGTLVVVDLHSPPGKSRSMGGYQDAGAAFFKDPDAQEQFVRVWEKIALRYRGNQSIWGFDLLNEPEDSQTAGDCLDWNRLALKTALAIRAVDPDRVIIMESSGMASAAALEWLRPLPMEGVVYSIHYYEPGQFTHQGVFSSSGPVRYPGMIGGESWNKDRIRSFLQPAVAFCERYRVRMYLGEFGAVRWAGGSETWLSDVASLCEEFGWDWTFHAFREWDGWSLEHGPDREDQRPLPRPGSRARAIRDYLDLNRPQTAVLEGFQSTRTP